MALIRTTRAFRIQRGGLSDNDGDRTRGVKDFDELATVRIVVEVHLRIKPTASNIDGIVLVGGVECEGCAIVTARIDVEASYDILKEAECEVLTPITTFAGGESTTAIVTYFWAGGRHSISVDTYFCAALKLDVNTTHTVRLNYIGGRCRWIATGTNRWQCRGTHGRYH